MHDEKLNILIVDDDQTTCDLLSDALTNHGCSCTKVLNGISAIKEMASTEYAIALLDIKLPDLSGIDLLKEIEDVYPNTSAIMITGNQNIEIAVSAMKLGAEDYLVKPFDIDTILFSIANVLKRKTYQEQLSDIDAISIGVEERQDNIDCHSEKVIKSSAEIARQLGISEEEIGMWVADRQKKKQDNKNRIQRAIQKYIKGFLTKNNSNEEDRQYLQALVEYNRN